MATSIGENKRIESSGNGNRFLLVNIGQNTLSAGTALVLIWIHYGDSSETGVIVSNRWSSNTSGFLVHRTVFGKNKLPV